MMEVAVFLAHVGSKTSCHRTIGVITKLDIMDRGTDALNFLLGKIIPLQLGYVGVVNRCQEDILMNRSVKDALIVEEKFFRSRPVYSDIADRCGVPQLAKKLNQILVQHIKTVLPGLKSRINATLVSVAKEHASYGEITESKLEQFVEKFRSYAPLEYTYSKQGKENFSKGILGLSLLCESASSRKGEQLQLSYISRY